MLRVGKREFTLHASKYMMRAEKSGEEIVITHQEEPRLKLVPLKKRSIRDLAGILTECRAKEPVNKTVLPDFDKW